LIGSVIYLIIIMYGNIYFILLGLLILGFASANFFPIVIRVALNNTKDNLNTMFVKPTGENKKIIFIKKL